jgi:hypothetical protein
VFWLALAFFLVAVLGSLGFAALRAWRLWKTVRATAKAATDAVGRVMTSAETAERRAVSLTAGTERRASQRSTSARTPRDCSLPTSRTAI